MDKMLRRLILILLLSAASLAVAQSSAPDAPVPQPDAGKQPAQTQPKPAAQPDPADPSSRPDWKPSGEEGYEKKSMGQRMKDTISTPPCVSVGGGACHQLPKKGGKGTETSQGPGPNQKPPRSDEDTRSLNTDGESSSRSGVIDLSPPKDDARNHPESAIGNKPPPADVSEMKKWDPHRAAKSFEVGDFYFKKQNWMAAESRYQEALEYKDNFAEAMFKLAVTEEKLQRPDEALRYYAMYLETLPGGDHAEEAQAAVQRLGGATAKKD